MKILEEDPVNSYFSVFFEEEPVFSYNAERYNPLFPFSPFSSETSFPHLLSLVSNSLTDPFISMSTNIFSPSVSYNISLTPVQPNSPVFFCPLWFLQFKQISWPTFATLYLLFSSSENCFCLSSEKFHLHSHLFSTSSLTPFPISLPIL